MSTLSQQDSLNGIYMANREKIKWYFIDFPYIFYSFWNDG